MYPTSTAFREAIFRSHTAISTAEAYYAGKLVAVLPLLDGSVSIDSRRDVLRTASLTVTDTDEVRAALDLFGLEVKIFRGVRLPGGDELVPLGVFRISDFEKPRLPDTITLNCHDRSQIVRANRWTDPYVVAAGTDMSDAIKALVTSRYPLAVYGDSLATGLATIGTQQVYEAGSGADPWKDARSLAKAYGWELYFDAIGVVQIRTAPDLATTPTTADYSDMRVVLSGADSVTYEHTYSGVVVTGEGTGTDVPVQAKVWDMDPMSPTYAAGPFGEVPYFFTSSLITTEDQALQTATSLLPRYVGRVSQAKWEQLVDPALEGFDIIALPESRYIVDQVTIPLKPSGRMSAVARETRST